jgi:hypothetical protein
MLDSIDADVRYRNWSERIQRISAETTTLFWSRKLVRAIGGMFETNAELRNSGGHVWNLILRLYGRDAVMAIRRELDGQARVVNLFHLLHDMEAHAPILTRARYHALMAGSPIRQVAIDREFAETFGAPPGPGSPEDHVPAEAIKCDRVLLQKETAKVLGYAQRFVAHRTPADTFPLTLQEVDDAIQTVHRCLDKYRILLTGRAMTPATPAPQYDWLAPFRIPWAVAAFRPPDDE